jgi:hypothetical protein
VENDVEGEGGGDDGGGDGGDGPDSGSILDKTPTWAIGAAFILLVGVFVAAVLIGMLDELSDRQFTVYQGIFTVVAAAVGAVFGVKIQSPYLQKAEGERERAQKERDRARDQAARERSGREVEQEKGRRKLSEAKARTIEAISSQTAAPETSQIILVPPRPTAPLEQVIETARESDRMLYAQRSHDDVPPAPNTGELIATLERVFEEVEEEE